MNRELHRLWQCLAHKDGLHEVVFPGADHRAFVPVTDYRQLERLAVGPDRAGRPLRLSAVPRGSADSLAVGGASVVWARLESGAGAAELQRFRVAPTFVLREAKTVKRLAVWALRRPLSYEWALRANRRLAHRLGAPKKHADPGFLFTPPGALTAEGKRVWVEFETDELYVPAQVVGGLRDAPDPSAWRDREAA